MTWHYKNKKLTYWRKMTSKDISQFFLNYEIFLSQKKIWTCIFYMYYNFFRVLWLDVTRVAFSKNASFGYLILVAIDIVSNVLHETDLVRCRSCQKTAEPLSTPDCHQPTPSSAATTCNWIGFWLIPSKYTARLPVSFFLDTILDTRGNFPTR